MLHLHHPAGSPTPASPSDGTVRQHYYGPSRTLWVDLLDLRWAPAFAAGNVLKYLRRHKDPTDPDKARWYYAALRGLASPYLDCAVASPAPFPTHARDAAAILSTLDSLLTPAEKDLLMV